MIEPNGRKQCERGHGRWRALLCVRAWGAGSRGQWEPEGEVTKSTQASLADQGQPAKLWAEGRWGQG